MLGTALLCITACTSKPQVQNVQNTATPGPPNEHTVEPTSPQKTEEPTAQPTTQPTPDQHPVISCLPATELNEHDYNAVRRFLEVADENGVRNGEKMNEYYDPDDPKTWFFWSSIFKDEEGNIPLADFSENGRLLRFFVPGDIRIDPSMDDYMETHYDFVGRLDLSYCEELISVDITYSKISSLDVTGCNDPHLDLRYTSIEEILPDPIEAFHVSAYGNKTKYLHWVTIPEEHEEFCTEGRPWLLNNFNFDLTVTAKGEGYVGINNDFGTDGSTTHSGVELSPYWDFENESIVFVGWYDANNNLITKERRIELPVKNEDGLVEGSFYYEARFKTLNAD